MRTYELTIIISPTVEEEGIQSQIESLTERITQAEGQVANVKMWGRRKLAYPIKKFTEGQYVLFTLQLLPESIKEIERDLLISETVLRHLVVCTDESA
jgi:small subunit ribosomal protein S6